MENEARLIGYTGRDVEVRTTPSGQVIGHLSVATTKKWKDKNTGDKREKTTWHSVVIFREQTTKFLQQYVPAGSLVQVKGEIGKRKYTSTHDNVEREVVEILIGGYEGSVTLLLSKDRILARNPEPSTPHNPETGEVLGTEQAEVDDEIPF